MTHPTVFGGATPPPANYQVANSVRMNGSGTYFTRSSGVQGNRRKWTVSTWIKRSALNNGGVIFASSTSGVDAHWLYYMSTNDKLYWQDYSGATVLELRASQISRDTSAWYHIMAVLDTAQPIASDRAKLYINGVLVALDMATYPGQHADLLLNQARPHTIGVTNYNGGTLTSYFNGYMSEFHFADGQALSPTDFGKFDANGVWVPIKYTGTYGTNGCKLEFKNAAALGTDTSGVSGYSQLNQSDHNFSGTVTISNSSRTMTLSGNPLYQQVIRGTHRITSKIYFEVTCGTVGNGLCIGVATPELTLTQNTSSTAQYTSNCWLVTAANGKKMNGGNGVTYGSAYSNGDIMMVAVDPTSGKIWWGRNGTWFGSGDPANGVNAAYSNLPSVVMPIFEEGTSGENLTVNFGNTAFAYTPPPGFGTLMGGNDWVSSGFTVLDQMVDTPTNNFCTWNPLTKLGGAGTLSNGNLSYLSPAGFTGQGRGTFVLSSGKWHWEVIPTVGSSTFCPTIGIIDADLPNNADLTDANIAGYGYTYTGLIRGGGSSHPHHSTTQTGLSPISSGEVIGVDLDCDNNTIAWYKNGVLVGAAQSIEKGHRWTLYVTDEGSIATVNFALNCGQRPWSVTPASSTFTAICTANLPAVAIPQPKNHFDVLLHSGTGAARTISGLSFQPDLVWAKDRSQVYNHGLFDSLRGAGNVLSSSDTAPETNYPQELTSFDVGGFSVGTGTGNFINKSGNAYVDWCWKAGGAAVTNTAGSITSQVSANPAAGFSIVTYTGTGTIGTIGTIGHGLGAAPKMVIVKMRNGVDHWAVYHHDTGNTGRTNLTTSFEFSENSTVWNNTSPTSSVFTVGTHSEVNLPGNTYIAYCFAEITGYSKFGRYTGNADPDGPFVYCGFTPRFIMWKASLSGSWHIHDAAREPWNGVPLDLVANTSAAEVSGVYPFDLLSNGFKVRSNDSEANIGTYVYAAFAEYPFGGSNVAPSPAR